MKVAVTGASGHAGHALCRMLTGRGYHVKALVHQNNLCFEDPNIEIIKGDLLNNSSLERLCSEAEVVFHLAAKISITGKDKDIVYRTNIQGTQNIAEVCLKLKTKKFIHFSSIHTLDQIPLDEELSERRPYLGHSKMAYEESKTEGEKIIVKFVDKGLNAVILIPTAIIGPDDYQPSFLGQALIKMYNNSLPMLVSGGYNWVDVRDVAACAITAAEKGGSGERYIVSGHWESLGNLSKLIGKVTGRKTPSLIAPFFLARIGLPFISIYSRLKKEDPLYTSNSLDILKHANALITHSKASQQLGYQPRPIEDTLKDTFDWYKQQNMIKP